MEVTLKEILLEQIVTEARWRRPDRALVESLRRFGLFIPIVVRAAGEERYHLIDGGRRVGGERELGRKSIRAILMPADASLSDLHKASAIINLQRRSLEHLSLARHIRGILAAGDQTQAAVARELGRSEGFVSQLLKVLGCPDLEAAIEEEGLEFGAARSLASLSLPERTALLDAFRAEKAKTGKFPSVHAVRERVSRLKGNEPPPPFFLEDVEAVGLELDVMGEPVLIRSAEGRKTQIKIDLTFTPGDKPRIHRLLASLRAANGS